MHTLIDYGSEMQSLIDSLLHPGLNLYDVIQKTASFNLTWKESTTPTAPHTSLIWSTGVLSMIVVALAVAIAFFFWRRLLQLLLQQIPL